MKLENVRGIIIVSGTAHYKFYKKNPEKNWDVVVKDFEDTLLGNFKVSSLSV